MKSGTITKLIHQSRGSDSAVTRLWSFYRSRLLKKSHSVRPAESLDSAEAIANAAFSDAIRWARGCSESPRNRDEMWSALSISAYRQGLQIRDYLGAKNRISSYETLPDSFQVPNDSSAELEDELAMLNNIDQDARVIIKLLASKYPMDEIARHLECPVRTMFRRVAKIKEALRERFTC